MMANRPRGNTMRRPVRTLRVGLLALAVGACAVHLSPRVHAAPPVAPAVEAFFAAIGAGDVDSIGKYLAEDYYMIGVSGRVLNKATRLEWLRQNVKQLSTITRSDSSIRYYGDVAIVTGMVEITNEVPTVYERFTHVWLYRDASWRMVSGQVTAVQPQYQPKPSAKGR
jgi:hypothetical protein